MIFKWGPVQRVWFKLFCWADCYMAILELGFQILLPCALWEQDLDDGSEARTASPDESVPFLFGIFWNKRRATFVRDVGFLFEAFFDLFDFVFLHGIYKFLVESGSVFAGDFLFLFLLLLETFGNFRLFFFGSLLHFLSLFSFLLIVLKHLFWSHWWYY